MLQDRPLRADARRNRDRLLEVARDAFAGEGLSTPLDEIARRAGVGPGTLYRHFPTKESLFEAVVHERLQRLADEARALRDDSDPGRALIGFLDRMLSEMALKRDLVDALDGAGFDLSTSLASTAAELRAEIDVLLGRAQRAETIRSDITVADLMALISGVMFALQSRSHDQADPRRVLSVLRDGLRAVGHDPVAVVLSGA
jgi:AcrR family transcriptional regulator